MLKNCAVKGPVERKRSRGREGGGTGRGEGGKRMTQEYSHYSEMH